MRVSNVPPRAVTAITRLSQFKAAGCVLVSHCSVSLAHKHEIDYDAAILAHGDVEVDYSFKTEQRCPECNAPGGGITILPTPAPK